MTTEELKETIKRELRGLLRSDPSLARFILDLAREEFADRRRTEDRFDQVLDEMRRDREEQARRWDTQNRKWDEQNRKWDEQNRKWDEQNRKWDEFQAETRKEFQQVHEEIIAQAQKHDRSVGALGSRWGMQTEMAFRNALAGILEKNFGVQVLNVSEYDDEGMVFGQPDQVEIDVIVKNDLLLICELKSSVSKADLYIFERKARFYEKRHGRTASRLLVISPMVDPQAREVAKRLGIEVYSDSVDVEAI